MKALRPHQIDAYERDGVLFPIPVLTPPEVALYRSQWEELESLNGGRIQRFDSAHMFSRWAYRLATHDSVVDAAASILGENILIDGTLILCKYPHDSSYVSWHQDSVYSHWHLSPTVSAWIALSPSTPENGCMRVIAASHEQGQLAHEADPDRNNLLRRGECVGAAVDESAAIDLQLRAGEMSLHHCNIIHGSNPNRSDEKRIGFIVRFVTDRIDRKDAVLVRARGRAECGHLNLVGEPAEMDQAAALERWREYSARRHRS
jgi:non-heme Fe2+,alpha-ketoglutarate-dependent halogenase